jgi:hypothetical protein
VAQSPEQLAAWLPPVDGWTIAGETEVFHPDNLFDRINGAAPLFIENNFLEMTSMEYRRGEEYITVQAYRHASPEDTFGMYSSERSSDLDFLPVGGEAQGSDTQFYCFAGCIYLKMQTNSAEGARQTLQEIADGLTGRIDPAADYPPILKSFPAKGKIPHTEAYIASSYIGHDFLKRVYLAKYEHAGQGFQLFVVDGKTQEGAKKVLEDYFSFTKQDLNFKEGSLIIQDKYNGDIPALWQGKYIIGIFNENGEQINERDYWLKEVAGGL